MGNIAFIKDKNIYINGVVSALKEEITEYSFQLYQYREIFEYKQKISPFPDLFIIELTSNIDLNKIVDNYKRENCKLAVFAFSTIRRNQIINLMQIGIDGYFYSDMEISEFRSAIKDMLKGYKYIHPYFSSIILDEFQKNFKRTISRPIGLLTEREWEVLENMVNGYQNEDIANHLAISDKTVKNHVSSILRKLAVKDRTNAVITAIKNNWISV